MAIVKLKTPLVERDVTSLKMGDKVLISGEIYAARDAAHKRLLEMVERGEKLPFEPKGSVIYYVGPAPAKPGKPIGPCGPTTSYRMDPYTEGMLKLGVKMLIGKGERSKEVRDALVKYKAVYAAATGGAATLLAEKVKASETVAFKELGPEALVRLTVEEFPVTVVNDVKGGDLYEEGR
ncbi:MAG: FumA C-terminus/TtdB family hydratase beta subunit, partial [Planctomycetota bacterium]|nr:FumA C-terminus/TtdB family hydratase beta subunit [Planctomycetota bacterium]